MVTANRAKQRGLSSQNQRDLSGLTKGPLVSNIRDLYTSNIQRTMVLYPPGKASLKDATNISTKRIFIHGYKIRFHDIILETISNITL